MGGNREWTDRDPAILEEQASIIWSGLAPQQQRAIGMAALGLFSQCAAVDVFGGGEDSAAINAVRHEFEAMMRLKAAVGATLGAGFDSSPTLYLAALRLTGWPEASDKVRAAIRRLQAARVSLEHSR